jgi:Mn2+/Fe2+ NRAMP family transporter
MAGPPAWLSPTADRRNALDPAHRGDILGALGTLREHDTGPRRTRRRRLLTLLAILGPGLVVMVADNDAGTISVFAQAGQDHGVGLLWVLPVLCGALFVTQEMVARLGAVTGTGHARLTLERFGSLWCAFSLGDLLVLNAAMLVTEFIGVALALGSFGISRFVAVPCAAGALVAVSAGGSFRRWERAMFLMIAADLALVPLALLGGPPGSGAIAAAAHASGPRGILVLLIALVGTTIAPWQLFFQQSTVVDKRITPRWLSYERADTAIGAIAFALCAGAVLVLSAGLLDHAPLRGHFTSLAVLIDAVGLRGGRAAEAIFALALLNASLLGAGTVSLSSSYALSEVLGVKHSLHRSFTDARTFHGAFLVMVALAAATVLVPGLPFGMLTTLVQALSGLLLPSTLVLLLLLCNDEQLLGPRCNGPVLNLIAIVAIGIILTLSSVLSLTFVLPGIGVLRAMGISVGVLGAVGIALALSARADSRQPDSPGRSPAFTSGGPCGVPAPSPSQSRGAGGSDAGGSLAVWQRLTWSCPMLERLDRPRPSRSRVLALALTRAYVLVVLSLLAFRAVSG